MGNYLDNDNSVSAANPLEVRQRLQERLQVLQTEEPHAVKPLSLLEKSGGSDGTRTRGLWRDRPAANGGFLRRFQHFHLHLPTFTYNDLHKNVEKRWLDSPAIKRQK